MTIANNIRLSARSVKEAVLLPQGRAAPWTASPGPEAVRSSGQ